MKPLRILLAALLVFPTASFAAEDDDWPALGHALTLIHTFVRISAHAENPAQGLDDVLAGRNSEANQAFAGLFGEITADMPAREKDKVAAIGRDLAALARKNGSQIQEKDKDAALRARKDLTAMGLIYYDENQYREAVKRGDRIAADLFIAAQGLPSLKNPPTGR